MKSIDKTTIQVILEEGKIGEISFPVWLQQIAASTDIPHIAEALAELGVTWAQWEQREVRFEEGSAWESHLIISLAPSATYPLSLHEHIWKMVLELRNPYYYSVNGSEVRIKFRWPPGSNGRPVPVYPTDAGP